MTMSMNKQALLPKMNRDRQSGSTVVFDRLWSDWTPNSLRNAFLVHGCAVLRGAIAPQALRLYKDVISHTYARTKQPLHICESDVREISDGRISLFGILADPKFKTLIERLFAGQTGYTTHAVARRIAGLGENEDWQTPLELHVDAQFHSPHFTLNFWVPLDDTGVMRPGLQLVPANYIQTRAYSGYTSELQRQNCYRFRGHFREGFEDVAAIKAYFGDDCFFRPKTELGDIVLSSNWILHGTYRTPEMRHGRMNVELRFCCSSLDLLPD